MDEEVRNQLRNEFKAARTHLHNAEHIAREAKIIDLYLRIVDIIGTIDTVKEVHLDR